MTTTKLISLTPTLMDRLNLLGDRRAKFIRQCLTNAKVEDLELQGKKTACTIQILIPADLTEHLKSLAKQSGLSANEIIRQLLDKHLPQ